MEYLWIIWLSLLGAIDSTYTALQQQYPRLFSFCWNRRFYRVDCHEILHSEYARLFKVPNSWIGIAVYLLLSIIYYYAGVFSVIGADRLLVIGTIVATGGFLISWYLVYVQAFVLKKFCPFCLFSTLMMTVITILSWFIMIS